MDDNQQQTAEYLVPARVGIIFAPAAEHGGVDDQDMWIRLRLEGAPEGSGLVGLDGQPTAKEPPVALLAFDPLLALTLARDLAMAAYCSLMVRESLSVAAATLAEAEAKRDSRVLIAERDDKEDGFTEAQRKRSTRKVLARRDKHAPARCEVANQASKELLAALELNARGLAAGLHLQARKLQSEEGKGRISDARSNMLMHAAVVPMMGGDTWKGLLQHALQSATDEDEKLLENFAAECEADAPVVEAEEDVVAGPTLVADPTEECGA